MGGGRIGVPTSLTVSTFSFHLGYLFISDWPSISALKTDISFQTVHSNEFTIEMHSSGPIRRHRATQSFFYGGYEYGISCFYHFLYMPYGHLLKYLFNFEG